MIGRNDNCWCGSHKKWKKCHYPELGGNVAPSAKKQYKKQFDILIKSEKEIEGIRRAGHLAASILNKICAAAKAGVTTNQLNTLAVKLHHEAGAVAAPLGYGYPPFPKSICTSLNEVICHGIPNDRPLQEGDILNIDVTCLLNGYYGDCSKMVAIGDISPEKQRVIDASYEGLMAAARILRPDLLLGEIGKAIEKVAHERGCSVVVDFVGHGVGVKFHEAPQIFHYANNSAIPLTPGMTFTIEPMINAGTYKAVIDPTDQWTARTVDGKPSAQFEHTFLITETGSEILTPWG